MYHSDRKEKRGGVFFTFTFNLNKTFTIHNNRYILKVYSLFHNKTFLKVKKITLILNKMFV